MEQIKTMASVQSAKAFVASVLAAIGAATVAAPDGFTLVEILVIAGALVGTFQATYWTTNATKYDGELVVVQQGPTKVFSLNLNTDPQDLEQKDQVTFKVNK